MLVITRSPESSHSSVVLPPLTFIDNEIADPDLRRVRKARVLSSDYNECGCPEAVVVDPIRQAAAAEAIARNIESERCTLQCPQDCETFESATCSDGVCIAE